MIIYDIEIINLKRIRLFLFVLLIIQILFIKFSDMPSLMNRDLNGIWGDKRYFIVHLFLSITSITGIISINLLNKNTKGALNRINKIFVYGLTIIILVSASILNALDQIRTGRASSVFIANILICSSIIIIKFPANIIVYFIPFATFIAGLFAFQNDLGLLYSNMINGIIFFIAVIIISKTTYDHQYDQMSKNILLMDINKKLDYLSNHDPLTGLLNRRNFENQARCKMEMRAQCDKEAILVLIDIDHFKYVNDKYGHPIGDMVLQEVSNILLDNLRDTDLASRWGGEEFLLLLCPSSINEAYELSNKIRLAIEEKVMVLDNFKIKITASFGISKLTGNFQDCFNVSYKMADTALYQAKNRGRNQVVISSF